MNELAVLRIAYGNQKVKFELDFLPNQPKAAKLCIPKCMHTYHQSFLLFPLLSSPLLSSPLLSHTHTHTMSLPLSFQRQERACERLKDRSIENLSEDKRKHTRLFTFYIVLNVGQTVSE